MGYGLIIDAPFKDTVRRDVVKAYLATVATVLIARYKRQLTLVCKHLAGLTFAVNHLRASQRARSAID